MPLISCQPVGVAAAVAVAAAFAVAVAAAAAAGAGAAAGLAGALAAASAGIAVGLAGALAAASAESFAGVVNRRQKSKANAVVRDKSRHECEFEKPEHKKLKHGKRESEDLCIGSSTENKCLFMSFRHSIFRPAAEALNHKHSTTKQHVAHSQMSSAGGAATPKTGNLISWSEP